MNNTTTANGIVNIVKDFLTGGHAVFTVASPKGGHYTYRVTAPRDQSDVKPIWFVGLLTGPNNTQDFTYLGLMNDSGGVWLTAKSKFTEDSEAYKVVKWAVGVVWNGKTVPEGYAIRHNGHCGRCGRELTHPESLETGIGPVCAGR